MIIEKEVNISPSLMSLLQEIEQIINTDQTPNFMNNNQIAQRLTTLLQSHPLQEGDWLPYAHFDLSKYTRNLIALGKDKRFGLMVLAWGPGQASPIHDHAQSHCVMRVLKGQLKEILYEMNGQGQLKLARESVLEEGNVAYIHDQIGWHSVGNYGSLSGEGAVSLHLYAPSIEKWDQGQGCLPVLFKVRANRQIQQLSVQTGQKKV
jgi:cysteine dioxygenase